MISAEFVQERMRQSGWLAKIVSIEHVSDLQKDLREHRSHGRLDDDLTAKYLNRFDFDIKRVFPRALSLLIVAAPQPRVSVTFTWKDTKHTVIVPPTYCLTTDDQIQKSLERILVPAGHALKKIRLPQKLLTVRSGLATYGKNNLSYVPGMGSFHRPVVFATDVACPQEIWKKSTLMKACENCKACLDACPTGALASGRFLAHAERCITFFNEHPGEFPAWLDPARHNAWVGCMLCQDACPMNQKFLNRVDPGADFSEQETDFLLRGPLPENFPISLSIKIDRLGLSEYMCVLGRNLKVVLKII